MKKIRYFTLLEVLISLGLTLLIFTVLLGAYLEAERSAAWWQKEEENLFPEKYLQQRLGEIFRQLIEADQEKSFFYTTASLPDLFGPETASLVFSYDNQVVIDPTLSSDVLGRLFVDLKGNLVLLTLPSKELWGEGTLPHFHYEILMPNVAQLHFEFFHLPQGENGGEKGWKSDGWSKELKYLPGVIKLLIQTKEGKSMIFLFPVPQIISQVNRT